MNRIYSFFVTVLVACSTVFAQGWVYSTEFGTDVWVGNDQKDVEYVNCNTGRRSAMSAQQCMRRDWFNGGNDIGADHTFTSDVHKTVAGLNKKVAAGISAQRPRRSSGTTRGRVGTYNHQTSDAHRAWLEQKRERDAEARARVAERKRYKDMLKKIEDDKRAAFVEAQTNARLQRQTDKAIARDYYNAGEGAYKATQIAREAARPKGPQFVRNKQQMSAEYRAGLLRRQNKPRRVMNNAARFRGNPSRKNLPEVKRTQTVDQEQTAMLRKALAVKAELIRRKREEQKRQQASASHKTRSGTVDVNGKAMVQLGRHATSTLGKDWNTVSLSTPDIPPRETKEKRKMTQKEYHNLIVIEMIDQRPLTPEERAYYSNLTLP